MRDQWIELLARLGSVHALHLHDVFHTCSAVDVVEAYRICVWFAPAMYTIWYI